jgi:predicted TIM-barrel fold metal-dependent hydrolase
VWSEDPVAFPFAHPTNRNFKPPAIAATAEALLAEMDRYGISQAVLVQVIYYGWDNRYLAHVLQAHPTRFRAQGLVDPEAADVADKFEALVREQGFSGVRLSPLYFPGRDTWLNSEAHVRLWRRAESLRGILNFFILPTQLARLATMIEKFPAVHVVIDHLARIELATVERDTAELVRLARFPNVSVKVSELNNMSRTKQYPYRDTYEVVKRVYDAFGPDRLLWGTGFPAGTRAQAGRPTLDEELALIRTEIPFFTASDREKILGRNAAALWRI